MYFCNKVGRNSRKKPCSKTHWRTNICLSNVCFYAILFPLILWRLLIIMELFSDVTYWLLTCFLTIVSRDVCLLHSVSFINLVWLKCVLSIHLIFYFCQFLSLKHFLPVWYLRFQCCKFCYMLNTVPFFIRFLFIKIPKIK